MYNPESELKKIFNIWNVDLPRNIYEEVYKPSKTVKQNLPLRDIEKQLSKWKNYFNKTTLVKLQAVLDYFNFDIYRMDNLYPKI